jgi:rhamnulokinase
VVPAGTELGRLRDETLAGSLRVIAPATHDTASAVAGTPLEPGWAYISSGTWSLVGVELPSPLLGPDVAAANFTNEAGAYATVRLLKNVMGLWLLESCRKEWPAEDVGALLARVAATRGLPGFVFPDAPELFSPESMVRELRAMLGKSGQPDVAEPAALAKVVLDSLALRYASVLETAERLTGQPIPGIHIVGGGSQNDYLNQATADAAGRPVLAGPVEATAAGNLLVQAIACGEIATIEEGRALLRSAAPPRRFEPRRSAEWDEARRRYREIEAMNR